VRELKFRGKALGDGRWVYGYYVVWTVDGKPVHCIINGDDSYPSGVAIDSDTLGQFTGLREFRIVSQRPYDGEELYEGDLIRFLGRWNKKGKPLPPVDDIYEVVWVMGGFWAIPMTGPNYRPFSSRNDGWKGVGHTDNVLVGNIYENPELLVPAQEGESAKP